MCQEQDKRIINKIFALETSTGSRSDQKVSMTGNRTIHKALPAEVPTP